MRTRLPRRYLAVVVLATLAVLAGTVGPLTLDALANPTAKDRTPADPPPRLFPDATVAPLQQQVTAQSTRAHALLQQWWSGHDPRPHDTEFVTWLQQHLPGPPPAAQRTREVARVQALASTRTPGGVTASTWLETHGHKDIWTLYAHDQAKLLPAARGVARKQTVEDMLELTTTVADTLSTKYRQPAPYVLHPPLHPSLHPDHVVAAGQVCPCSYPSRHAAAAAAASTYLTALDPRRADQYRSMQSQIDYSRLYMATHTSSDVTAGALLGDLIGEYYLVTRP